MELDPRHRTRLRDRALDRLDGLTTSAAVLGVVATAGLGSVAAVTTHVPGVSATDTQDGGFVDDSGSGTAPDNEAAPGDDDTPNRTSPSGSSRSTTVQPPANTGVQAPTVRTSRHRHASTGGS
jgi:hypothetical protein